MGLQCILMGRLGVLAIIWTQVKRLVVTSNGHCLKVNYTSKLFSYTGVVLVQDSDSFAAPFWRGYIPSPAVILACADIAMKMESQKYNFIQSSCKQILNNDILYLYIYTDQFTTIFLPLDVYVI